jgi:hypothetical protein
MLLACRLAGLSALEAHYPIKTELMQSGREFRRSGAHALAATRRENGTESYEIGPRREVVCAERVLTSFRQLDGSAF